MLGCFVRGRRVEGILQFSMCLLSALYLSQEVVDNEFGSGVRSEESRSLPSF
jgi:hypothetical protein